METFSVTKNCNRGYRGDFENWGQELQICLEKIKLSLYKVTFT